MVIEEYEDMESDASNARDATTVIEGQEHEAASQEGQMIRQPAVGVERNRSGNAGVLRAASGGKSKVETRHSAKDRPSSIIALKLIAKQGADKKEQLEQWKEDLVAKLTSEMA